jgi:flagellin
MERLASGRRINSSADDAAGLAVGNKMLSQLGGVKTAIRNSQDGVSLVQTADGALDEISKLIRRMRELAVQMQNGIYTAQDRSNAQMEIKSLLAEVNKIAQNTQYNKVNLLDGNYDQTVRAGNSNDETIRLAIGSVSTSNTAKITNFAVEKAIGHTSDSPTRTNAQNELEVFEATSVQVETDVWSDTFKTFFNADSLGTFSKTTTNATKSADNGDFNLDSKTGKLTSTAAIASGTGGSAGSVADTPGGTIANSMFRVEVTYTNRAGSTHVEQLEINVKNKTETSLDDLKIETTADAGRAVETLDKALEEVSTAQAKLGASQNRLSHNIDNLSKSSMLIEQSVGRIMDADFAAETAELSKQKILSQAATSMLAQANVSKQAVIALLR